MSAADDFIRSMAGRDPQELEQLRAEAWGVDPLAAARDALVLYATTTRTVTADGLAPLIDQLLATAACPCYPNPFDHEDHCPRRNA